MSGFPSNLSDTIAAARVRATRSGDTLRSLLSPSQPSSSSTSGAASLTSGGRPPGVTFAALGRQMAGLFAGSGEGEGGYGEFSLRVGGPRDLSIFVLDAESSGHLCLGAVNGGIKFCCPPWISVSLGLMPRRLRFIRHMFTSLRVVMPPSRILMLRLAHSVLP